MLNESQVNRVWENMLSAETRALYFGDLGRRYSLQKQWMTGLSFFLSSGAAATVIAKAPTWVPALLAILSAGMMAYAMAINLDRLVATTVKLHCMWRDIATSYDRLWNHAYDDDAEEQLNEIISRETEPSELAVTEAPNDQKLLRKWEDHVFELYHLTGQNA
jgi:hypothetical protein